MSAAPPVSDLPDELVEILYRLDHQQLTKLIRYSEAVLNERTPSLSEAIHESQDSDRIVRIDEQDGYALVERKSTDDGEPILYHVRQEPRPDGSIDLHWKLLGKMAEE